MSPKKRSVCGGQCKAHGCKEKTITHDLPLCREHWLSVDQEDRTWYVDPPYECDKDLAGLLKRSGLDKPAK